jgi:ribonuclease HII
MRPDFSREAACAGLAAGVDEAGRGPWAGPVVAAIVILDKQRLPAGVNDSKQLSKPKREALFSVIMESALAVGVGRCSTQDIDQYNILGATKLAMLRAYDALTIKPDIAFVDGNQLPSLPCDMEAIVEGDGLCISIAAASIIAKVTRDRLMSELAVEFPQYGWERNAGYGTKEHQEALAKYGVTLHHRRSFAPIRKLLQVAA